MLFSCLFGLYPILRNWTQKTQITEHLGGTGEYGLYLGDLNVLFEEAFEHFSDFLKWAGFLLHVKRPGNDPFFQETLCSDCMFCHCFSSSFVDTCFTEDAFKMFHFHTKKPVLFWTGFWRYACASNCFAISTMTFTALTMLSTEMYSNLPWKFSPPVKMFGVGSPM